MSMAELEVAVSSLSKDELDRFNAWYEEYLAQQWDRQIEADAASGKFDAMFARAYAAFDSGQCAKL